MEVVRPSRSEIRDQEKILVGRMLAGEEAAFDEFADGYFPGLYRFARSRLSGDQDTVREIVQITLCKAIANLKSYRHESSLFSWLCSCCLNEIRMHFRSRKRAPQQVELDESVLAKPLLQSRGGADDGPEARLLRVETSELVHVALDQLPERYARALEWKYIEKLAVVEIAERLEVSAKAAESLLTRARAAFRKIFEVVGEVDKQGAAAETSGARP